MVYRSFIKQIIVCIYIFFIPHHSGYAQNLVPNPSFETYSSCPTTVSQTHLAVPWNTPPNSSVNPTSNPVGTSDFFNSCHIGNCRIGVPNNLFGYAPAFHGTGYAGFFTHSFRVTNSTPVYREYVQAPLLSPMTANITYHISFRVRRARVYSLATNNIGMYISNGIVSQQGSLRITGITPQIEHKAVIRDTSNWTLITGTYTAAGGEDYITIGNFRSEANTTMVNEGGRTTGCSGSIIWPNAYYYIDSIFVGLPPVAPVAGFAASDTSICVANCINFTDTSTGTPTSWNWTFPGATPISSTTQHPSSICYPNAGVYTVSLIVSNTEGYDTAYKTIIVPPINTTILQVSICAGSTYTLPDGTSVSTTGIYSNTLTANNGCDSVITIDLLVNPLISTTQQVNICAGSTYTLPDGTPVNTTGIYSNTLTANNGCDSVITIDLLVNPLISTTQQVSICTGSAYTLPNGTSVNTTGIYSNTLLANNGCDSIVITDLIVQPLVSTTQQISICAGSIYTLPDGTSVSTTGIYSNTLTANNGCDSVITIDLLVNPLISTTQQVNICAGSTYTLPDGTPVNITGIYSNTLTANNGCDSVITTDLLVHPVWVINQYEKICFGNSYTLPGGNSVSASGIYAHTLTSVYGCDSILQIILNVDSLPLVTIQSSNSRINNNETIILTAYGANSFLWSNGESNQTISVTHSANGIFNYCVEGTDVNNCSDTACFTLRSIVSDCVGKIFVPTAFSPNRDGQNDVLHIYDNGCIKTMVFSVYNRWGEIIFTTNDLHSSWDGSFKGQAMDAGAFSYILNAETLSNEKITIKGSVTLLR